MPRAKDPTEAMRKVAAAFPTVAHGTACNQSSFKTGKRSFLFVGPGAKGLGYKAMFKLEKSMPQAEQLADKEPDRYEVGSTGWVTARFTVEKPLPKTVWERWLKESYELCCEPEKSAKKKSAVKKSKAKASVTKKVTKTKRRKSTTEKAKKKSAKN